jgi:uncharacterized protein (TIGR02466 family)
MSIINLFSVPISVIQLSGLDSLHLNEVDTLKRIQLNKQYGDDGNHLSEDVHVLEKYNLVRLRSICDREVKKYTRDVLGIEDEFKMFKSWLSMNERGTRHEPHSHRNTMISCIVYFDEYMSEEIMAPINFGQDGLDQIFKTFQFAFKVRESNQYNTNVLTVFPKTNTMIIFPGWIRHETQVAQSTTKRYCLGTNYFFVGESSNGYHNINVSVK